MKTCFSLIFLFALTQLLHATPLEDLLADPALKTASVGFSLLPLKNEASLDEDTASTKPRALHHQPDTALTPTSVQKALTTAAALQILGPDYRFRTQLYRSGKDIIIKGGGDPLLASSSVQVEFPAWHQALQKAGLSEISGTLIADPSFFEDRTTPNQWLWGDIGNYYGAGPNGLNFHRNSYLITFRPSSVGGPARLLSTYPKPPEVSFQNFMKTGSPNSGDQGYAYVGPNRKLVTFRGTVPAGRNFTIRGALPDPPLSCLTAFRDYLAKKGFAVKEIAVRRNAKTLEENLLHTTESPSLAKLIIPTNMKSINLNADCIFKALTTQGSTSASQKTLRRHWTEQGVDLAGFLAHDGSGLSPQNTITARQAAHILQLMASSEHQALFRASLPIAGRSGTLRRFPWPHTTGNLVAKSSSMERVQTWTGYLTTKSGREHSFALLINHYNGSDSAVRLAASRFLNALWLER